MLCIHIEGEARPIAMRGLKLSELKTQWALILVSSSLAQQCSEQQRGASTSRAVCVNSSDCFKYLCLFSIAKLASLLEIVTHWYQNKTEK